MEIRDIIDERIEARGGKAAVLATDRGTIAVPQEWLDFAKSIEADEYNNWSAGEVLELLFQLDKEGTIAVEKVLQMSPTDFRCSFFVLDEGDDLEELGVMGIKLPSGKTVGVI